MLAQAEGTLLPAATELVCMAGGSALVLMLRCGGLSVHSQATSESVWKRTSWEFQKAHNKGKECRVSTNQTTQYMCGTKRRATPGRLPTLNALGPLQGMRTCRMHLGHSHSTRQKCYQ